MPKVVLTSFLVNVGASLEDGKYYKRVIFQLGRRLYKEDLELK